MAAYDFSDAVARSIYLGRRETGDEHDEARAAELCNEAHVSLCDSGDDWRWLRREGAITLTAAQDKYTYASIESALGYAAGTLREVLSLTNDTLGSDPMRRLDWMDLEGFANSSQDSAEVLGEPLVFARINDALRVYPKPAEAYTLGALLRVQPVTLSGTNTFLMPNSGFKLIYTYAAIRLLWEDSNRDALSLADRLAVQYEKDLEAFRISWATPEEDISFRSSDFTQDLDRAEQVYTD